MATNTRNPKTDEVRLIQIFRETHQGLHDWITRDEGKPDDGHADQDAPAAWYDDPMVVLADVTGDELVDYLMWLERCAAARWKLDGEAGVIIRYRDFAAVVGDEIKSRLAAATDVGPDAVGF